MQLQFTLTPTTAQKAAYFRLREACFRRELRLDEFDGREDAWDRSSELLIALDGDRCIGGVRISGGARRTDLKHAVIPLETQGARVPRLLPELALEDTAYCQPTRLVVTPHYRTPRVLNAFAGAIVRQSAHLGFSHCIAVSGMARSRFYRRSFHACGFDYRIYEHIVVPPEPGFSDLPHILSVGFLATGSNRCLRDALPKVA